MNAYTIPPQTHIGHVHLKVADLERAIQFYCETLGFTLMQRMGSSAAFISAGGPPPPPGCTGLYHIAILYPTRTDLANALKRLVQAEIPLEGAADHGVSEALYLRDPDGNGVELYRDLPAEEWPRTPEGELHMYTRALDLRALLQEAS